MTQIFYWPISFLTKMAFLFFYLRIFPRQELRKYIYAAMGITFCYYVGFQFGNIFYCRPISMVWKYVTSMYDLLVRQRLTLYSGWDLEHKGTCLSINNFMVLVSPSDKLILRHTLTSYNYARSASAVNIAIDLIIMIIPIPELLKLSMSWRKKLGLLAIFMVGIL
jgi:hypothetical protein